MQEKMELSVLRYTIFWENPFSPKQGSTQVDVSESQGWSVLIQKCFSSDTALFITRKFLSRDESELNSAENENFQC